MYLITVIAALAQAGADESTMAAVRRSLPLDPAAIFTLALSAVAIAAVIIGGRGKGGSDPDDKD